MFLSITGLYWELLRYNCNIIIDFIKNIDMIIFG